jgi:hypothetical protein
MDARKEFSRRFLHRIVFSDEASTTPGYSYLAASCPTSFFLPRVEKTLVAAKAVRLTSPKVIQKILIIPVTKIAAVTASKGGYGHEAARVTNIPIIICTVCC